MTRSKGEHSPLSGDRSGTYTKIEIQSLTCADKANLKQDFRQFYLTSNRPTADSLVLALDKLILHKAAVGERRVACALQIASAIAALARRRNSCNRNRGAWLF